MQTIELKLYTTGKIEVYHIVKVINSKTCVAQFSSWKNFIQYVKELGNDSIFFSATIFVKF